MPSSRFVLNGVCRMREREREEARRAEEATVEAEELRRLAAEFAAEQRRKEETRRGVAARQAEDNKRQIDDTELMRQIDRMQEEVAVVRYVRR